MYDNTSSTNKVKITFLIGLCLDHLTALKISNESMIKDYRRLKRETHQVHIRCRCEKKFWSKIMILLCNFDFRESENK